MNENENEKKELTINDMEDVTGGRIRRYFDPSCPRCGSRDTVQVASEGEWPYLCNDCGTRFTPVWRKY